MSTFTVLPPICEWLEQQQNALECDRMDFDGIEILWIWVKSIIKVLEAVINPNEEESFLSCAENSKVKIWKYKVAQYCKRESIYEKPHRHTHIYMRIIIKFTWKVWRAPARYPFLSVYIRWMPGPRASPIRRPTVNSSTNVYSRWTLVSYFKRFSKESDIFQLRTGIIVYRSPNTYLCQYSKNGRKKEKAEIKL